MKTSFLSVAVACAVLALGQPAGAQYSQKYDPQQGGSVPGPLAGAAAAGAPAPTPGQPVYVTVPEDANGVPQLPPGAQVIPPGAQEGGECAQGSGCGCGCDGGCQPKWTFFGDYLFLRPGNAQVDFAVPRNSAYTGTTIQGGQVGSVDVGYDTGFRIGATRQLDAYSSVGVTYTQWHGDNTNDVAAPTSDFIVHPMITQTPFTNDDATDASAHLSMRFDLADVDYRWKFYNTDRYSLTFVGGARYAHLDQQLFAQFNPTINDPNGNPMPAIENVQSRIEFEGAGINLGLEAERRSASTGLLVYGHGMASFVAGEARARYDDVTNLFPTFPIDANWKSPRVVSMLNLELGVGWASPGDHVHVSAGYMFNGWFNVVKMNDYINSVQADNFSGLGHTLSFDGFVGHAEFRY